METAWCSSMNGRASPNLDNAPTVDRSFAECELPDLCIWRLVGDVTERDIERLFAAQTTFAAGKAQIFVLVDLSRVRSVSPKARAAGAQSRGVLPVRGIASCGGSFGIRALASLVARAAKLLSGQADSAFEAFETEAEARRWFADRRRQLAKPV